jgi:hypothetical protein
VPETWERRLPPSCSPPPSTTRKCYSTARHDSAQRPNLSQHGNSYKCKHERLIRTHTDSVVILQLFVFEMAYMPTCVTFSRYYCIVNIFWPLEDPLWAFMLQNCVRPFSSAHMKAYACSCVPPHAPASRYLDDASDHSCHVQLLPSCTILCMTRLPACLCGYKCLRLICNAISLHPCHADRMTAYALFPLFDACRGS